MRTASRILIPWGVSLLVIGLLSTGCRPEHPPARSPVPRDLYLAAMVQSLGPGFASQMVEVHGDGRGRYQQADQRTFKIDSLAFQVDSGRLAEAWRSVEEDQFFSLAHRYENPWVYDGALASVMVRCGHDSQFVIVTNAFLPPFTRVFNAIGRLAPPGRELGYEGVRLPQGLCRSPGVTLRELRGELGWQCARLAATARRALGIRRPSGIRELRAGERVYRQDTMVVTGRFVDEDQDGTDETLELDAALPLEFWRYEVCGALDAGSLRGGPSRRVTGREDGRTHVRYRFPVDSVRGAPRTSPRRLAVLAVPLAPRDPSGPYYPDQVWFGVFALPPGSRAD